jgi:Spy/CpxP family protein refolding chaperone
MNAHSFHLRFAALAAATLSSIGLFAAAPASANTFSKTEVRQNNFIAVAAPVGSTRHQLLILEQISNDRPCWQETGANPVEVDPLLLDFDFTGICGRSTDSNGYSIRVGDRDLGMQYNLRIVRDGDDMVLMGVPFSSRSGGSLEIGRARGVTSGFAKLQLNSGWRFSKRNYDGRTLGHVYLTNDLTLSELTSSTTTASRPTPTPQPKPPVTTPTPPSQPSGGPQLQLSAEQIRQLQAIETRYNDRIATQSQTLQQARQQLNQMMGVETSDRTLRRQQKQIRELQAELSDLHFEKLLEMRSILNAEQRGQFAQLLDGTPGQIVGSR